MNACEPVGPGPLPAAEHAWVLSSDFCRLRYEGPATLLRVLARMFRQADVVIASARVDGHARRPAAVAECDARERLSLALLCRADRQSVESVVQRFTDGFGAQAVLTFRL